MNPCEHKRILHDGTPKRRLVSCKDCGCKMGWHKGDWVGTGRGVSSATETNDVVAADEDAAVMDEDAAVIDEDAAVIDDDAVEET